MTPVVMLAINTGAFPSALCCLTMTCPSFEYTPVIYLMTVAVRAASLITKDGVPTQTLLSHMVKGTQLAYQTLSLLINIYATSIIALKAWCVCVDSVFGTHLLIAPRPTTRRVRTKGNGASF
jgi:hypothetical protein